MADTKPSNSVPSKSAIETGSVIASAAIAVAAALNAACPAVGGVSSCPKHQQEPTSSFPLNAQKMKRVKLPYATATNA